MNCTRLAATAVVFMFTLSSCGGDDTPSGDKAQSGDETRATFSHASPGNDLLSFVPAASPYVFANLKPTPAEVVDHMLQQAEPVLQALQSELSESKARLEAGTGDDDKSHRLLLAILRELDGKLDRPGIESLGIDLQSSKVIYGMGAFPIARIGLADAPALTATVQRILDEADIQAPPLDFQGQSYWRITPDHPADQNTKQTAAIYIAILQDQLAVGMLPIAAENDILPNFLGLQKPAQSDAASRLTSINEKYDYTDYGTGVLDWQLLANEFTNPGSLLRLAVAESGAEMPSEFSEVCKQELAEIIQRTPRVVVGTTELSPKTMAYQAVLETTPSLASELIALVADVPAVQSLSARLLELSFGVNVGQAREFVRNKLIAMTQTPYQCEQLAQMNENAAGMLARVNQPMPPLVNNFRGLRLSLSQLDTAQLSAGSIAGLLAVYVAQPEMFVGMAQMFLPDLASLNLVKGEPPVQVPATLIPAPNVVAFAVVNDDAIGLSLGAGEEAGLTEFLDQPAANDGTFLSVNYDAAAYQNMTQKWATQLQHEYGVDASKAEAEEVARELSAAVQKAYQDTAGRMSLSLRFTKHGFVTDSRLTFK